MTLVYFTDGWPGKNLTEGVFVAGELPALARRFSKVILVPLSGDPSSTELPEYANVSVDWGMACDRVQHSRLRKMRWLFHPFVIRSILHILHEAKNIKQFQKGLFAALNVMSIGRSWRRIAKRLNLQVDDTLLYSFWFHHQANGLARESLRKGWRLVVRAHSFDIFNENTLFRSDSMRRRLMPGIERVYTISEVGREYLQQKFPEYSSRISLARLGSSGGEQHNVIAEHRDERKRDDEITLVTVARLTEGKRHAKTMRVLSKAADISGRKIRWIVVGDGPEMEHLKAQARNLKGELTIDFRGMLSNADVHKLYEEERPEWHILLSAREGIPVSLGESMSHGVPVITTIVGGIGELVDESCGVPISADMSEENIALIVGQALGDESRRESLAEASKAKWCAIFDSKRLAEQFADRLITPNPITL